MYRDLILRHLMAKIRGLNKCTNGSYEPAFRACEGLSKPRSRLDRLNVALIANLRCDDTAGLIGSAYFPKETLLTVNVFEV